MGRLYDMDDERLMDHVEQLLDLFDLREQADSPIRHLLGRPEEEDRTLLGAGDRGPGAFLDEPFSGGLDPAGLLDLEADSSSTTSGGKI